MPKIDENRARWCRQYVSGSDIGMNNTMCPHEVYKFEETVGDIVEYGRIDDVQWHPVDIFEDDSIDWGRVDEVQDAWRARHYNCAIANWYVGPLECF